MMTLTVSNPWEEIAYYEALVTIRTHHLYASVSGPTRAKGEPLVIFITGAGAPVAVYIKLRQHLATFCRTLFYDRAGYDQSSRSSTNPVLATDSAEELDELLHVTKLQPPYLLVAHSYGGIIAREFLDRYADDEAIFGMVLFDTVTELMLQLFARLPSQDLQTVFKGVNWAELTDLKRESGMSEQEWKTAMEAVGRSEEGAAAEDTHLSGRMLAEKHQFDSGALSGKPLSVVRCNVARDYEILFEAGVRLGNGSAEQRRSALYFIKTIDLFHSELIKSLLNLSPNHKYLWLQKSSHDTPIREPDIVGREVELMLGVTRPHQQT